MMKSLALSIGCTMPANWILFFTDLSTAIPTILMLGGMVAFGHAIHLLIAPVPHDGDE